MAKNNVRLPGSTTTGSSTRHITAHARHTADIKAHSGYSNVDYDPQDLLAQIQGVDYSSLDDAGKSQFLDMLNVLKTIDQRQYDRWLTQEDRQYNSIQSQLGRLMATGMSRDAALSMLTNGATQIQNVASPFGADSSMFPSQTALNENQVTTNNIGSAVSIVGTVLGMVQMGIGLPSLLSSNEISRNAAYVSGQQTKAYQALGTISDLAGAAIQGGKLATDNLKDRDSFIAGMDGLYSANPQYQGAMAALRSNPFGMQTLDNYVNQNFATKKVRPTSELVDKATKSALTEFLSSSVRYDQLCASLSLTREQINKVVEETQTISDLRAPTVESVIAHNNLLGAQTEESRARTSLLGSQEELARAQAESQEQENFIRSWTVRAYDLKGEDFTAALTTELAIKLNALNAANDDESRNAIFESIISNSKLARCYASINLLNAQSAQDFLKDNESLQSMCGLLQTTDFDKYMSLYLQSRGIDLRSWESVQSYVDENPMTVSSSIIANQKENLKMISGSYGHNPFGMFDPLLKQ